MPYVYKYVLNGEIIYIGKSYLESFDRLRTHGHGNKSDNIPVSAHAEIDKADIYIAIFSSPQTVDILESLLINKYKPKYNVRNTNLYEGLAPAEIEWISLSDLQNRFLRTPTLNDVLRDNEYLRTHNEYLRDQIEEYRSENETLKQMVKNLTEQKGKTK